MLAPSRSLSIVNYCASALDRDALRRAAGAPPVTPVDDSLADRIVRKPWGSECLLYEGRSTAIWMLNLKPGHMTSMHCHRRKRTTLIVICGSICFRTLSGELERSVGEGVWVGAGVFHQSEATGSGATLLEVEAPVNKFDLVRLADLYGRHGTGYEGPEHTHPSQLTTLKAAPTSAWRQQIGPANVSIFDPRTPHAAPAARDLHCVLEGGAVDIEGYAVMGAGDCLETAQIGKRIAYWRPGSLIATISTTMGSPS